MRKTRGGEHAAPGPSSCLPGPGWHWQRQFTGNPCYQWRDREFPGASPSKVCGARSFPVSAHTLPSAVLSTLGTVSSFLRTFPSSPASFKQPLSLVQSESESALEQLPLNASSSEPKHPFPAGPQRPAPWRTPEHSASVRRRPCSFWDGRPGRCKRSPPSCESPSSPCGTSRVRPSLRPSADTPDSLPRCGLLLPGANPRWGLRTAASRLR